MTFDNASNNNQLVNNLAQRVPMYFSGSDKQGHCMAHILNLIAKAIGSVFGSHADVEVFDEDTGFDLPDHHIDGGEQPGAEEGDQDGIADSETDEEVELRDGNSNYDSSDDEDSANCISMASPMFVTYVCQWNRW
jgi:hypothetical protein